MSTPSLKTISKVIEETAQPLSGESNDYDSLLTFVGDARLCLLGEATHGTHEFYRERAEITKRLIKEKGFTAVAVEADWPDAFRVNRYVRGLSDDKNADEALGGFKRFPTWMWRNTVSNVTRFGRQVNRPKLFQLGFERTTNMPTEEIPREQWSNFFDSFSRQHEGWLATLEIFDANVGAQQEAEELPFEGISLDSDDGEPESMIISFGNSPSDHITHTIHSPKHLWLQRTSEGADAALEIKAEDNSNTLLRFRSPMLPEFVDGIV